MHKKGNYKIYCFTLLAMLFSFFSFSQTTVKVKADAQRITIGDQFRLFIEATHSPSQGKLNWPQLPQLNGLEIVDTGKIDTSVSNGATLYKQQLILTGFDSGAYVFPQLQFSVSGAGAQPLFTDSLRIDVQTIAVDTTKPIKPIKDIIEVKKAWWEYWPWVVGALALAGLIMMIIYLRKKKKTKEIITRVPPERAHEKALRRLQEIAQTDFYETGKIKEYYTELTDVLRDYIDERFGIPAAELTTDDLLKLAKQQSNLKKIRPELKHIFRTADLAKFAKAAPEKEEYLACMEDATKLVNRTKMLPEEGIAP